MARHTLNITSIVTERLQVKRDFFSGKFRILKIPSGQEMFVGKWSEYGTQLEIMNAVGDLLVAAIKKTPKGIHLSWKQKYVISFPNQNVSTELTCTKPFKNLWEATIEDRDFKLNSPLRKDIEIYEGNEIQLKEIEEDEFIVKTSNQSKMIASIAFYLCVRQQHSGPPMV